MPATKSSSDKRRSAELSGRWAERLCAVYLVLKGYAILDHRFKTRVGEIDLIAKRGNTIAFVEVKARKSADDALQAVSRSQRERIERAASLFLAQNKRFAACDCRFDVMAPKRRGLPLHLRGAWSSSS